MLYFSSPRPQVVEQKDQVAVEQILRVVFLDAERSTPVSAIVVYDCFCICAMY